MKSKWWSKWLRLDRILPLATIIGVFIAILLSIFQVVELTLFENMVLGLLGLIGFDSFIERMGILEKILKALERKEKVGPELLLEEELLSKQPFDEFIRGANEVFIFGGSLAGLIKHEFNTIETWLGTVKESNNNHNGEGKDANLKLLLVDPQLVRKGRITVQSLFRYFGMDDAHARKEYAKDVEKTIRAIGELQKSFPAKIEVRLTKETPSVTLVLVDKRKARVSVNLYQNDLKKRPIFEIRKDEHYGWYDTFENLYYRHVWDCAQRIEGQP